MYNIINIYNISVANDTIHAGIGIDYVSAGSGENYIYLGKDYNYDEVDVSGTGIDHIHEATDKDLIKLNASISSQKQIGNNFHITLVTGKEVILYNFMNDDKDNPSDNGNPPFLADNNTFSNCDYLSF